MFWTLPRKGRRTRTQIIMNKKIYNTPLVEQAECIGMSNLCNVSPNKVTPASPENGETEDPINMNGAPKRVMF